MEKAKIEPMPVLSKNYAEKVIANIQCADACYCCNQKYGECNVQHRDYGSKECVDRLLMLTKEDL